MSEDFPIKRTRAHVELFVLAGIIIFCALATHERNTVWNTGFSLWLDVVRKSPQKARGHVSLGAEYYKRNMFAQAAAEYKTALRLEPDAMESIPVHYDLAIICQRMGLIDLAIAKYKEFLKSAQVCSLWVACDKIGRYIPETHNNLGVCYFAKKEIKYAIREFEQVLAMNPDHKDARYNLRIVRSKLKEPDGNCPHKGCSGAHPEN